MPHAPDEGSRAKGASPPSAETFENQVLSLVPSLRRYSRSLAKSDSDGEDLLQEGFQFRLVQRLRLIPHLGQCGQRVVQKLFQTVGELANQGFRFRPPQSRSPIVAAGVRVGAVFQ